MANKTEKLSDQIRNAVDASGMSRYRICKELQIAESTMSRFMAGGGMELATIDALAELIGLGIKTSRPKRAVKGKVK